MSRIESRRNKRVFLDLMLKNEPCIGANLLKTKKYTYEIGLFV